jgi:hypothetical protein
MRKSDYFKKARARLFLENSHTLPYARFFELEKGRKCDAP